MRYPAPWLTSPGRALGLALTLSALAGSEPASGAPLYRTYLWWGPNSSFLVNEQTATPPEFISGSGSLGDGQYTYFAEAHPGIVHTNLTLGDYSPANYSLSLECKAIGRIDDLVIRDGTGVSKSVSLAIRFDVAGVAGYTYAGGGDRNKVIATGEVDVAIGSQTRSGFWAPAGGRFSTPYPSSGLFAGYSDSTLSGTFQVAPVTVTTEVPISLTIATNSNVAPSAPDGGWIQGQVEMAANFARAVPALVLPAGFLGNSSQGGIQDNWFVGEAVSVAPAAPGGRALELAQNAPNPFSGGTEVAFTLPAPGAVRLHVFDVTGARVAELASGEWAAGRHVVRWTGHGADGRPVPPGVYFCALEASGERIARRMLRIH
jgi:hypothetical protein